MQETMWLHKGLHTLFLEQEGRRHCIGVQPGSDVQVISVNSIELKRKAKGPEVPEQHEGHELCNDT